MTEWAWTWVLVAATGGSSEVLEALAPTQGGLTTEQVIERSVATAPLVMKAEAEAAIRESDADVAFLVFTPRLDGLARYARLSKVPPNFIQPTENAYVFRAILSVPVSDYFLTAIHQYGATFAAEEAAQYQARATREGVALRAVEAFINSVRARASEVVFRKSVDVLGASLADLIQLENAGMIASGDVLQVKAQVATARVELELAKGRVQFTREVLRRAIDDDRAVLEHGEDVLALVARPAPEMKASLDEAMAERYEVKALHGVIEARSKLVAANFGRVFPRLTVDAQAEYSNPNQRFFRMEPEFDGSWLIGVNLGWSPNDSVLAWSDSNKAEQEVSSAKADLAEVADAIAIEVADAVSTYRARRESIGAAQEAVDAAQGTFNDRQNLLAAGGGTTRELLLSEQDLRRAQLQLINAHLDLRLALAQLDRALGHLVMPAP